MTCPGQILSSFLMSQRLLWRLRVGRMSISLWIYGSNFSMDFYIVRQGISQRERYFVSTISFGKKSFMNPGVFTRDQLNISIIIHMLQCKYLLIFLIHLTLFAHTLCLRSYKPNRLFRFKNSCSQTIWVGGFGVPLPTRTGWEMPSNSQFSLSISASTVAIRFWGRTGCGFKDGKFQCATGDCGAPLNNFGIECRGITGQSPATLIELTLSDSGRPDFYDMSNVDGNNLNMRFGPIQGTYTKVNNPDLGKFNCGTPSCSFNQNVCPPQLTLEKPTGKYCMSICAAIYNADQVRKYPDILGPIANDPMKRDLVCCACGQGTGGCEDARSHFCCSPLDPRSNIGGRCYVETWPKPSQYFDRYDRVFKNQCNQAYSWQFDDISSTYQCIDADYEIEFCSK